MKNQNLELESYTNETPVVESSSKKSMNFNSNENRVKRVDINVLKSRIQEKQTKETRQNLTVFGFFLLAFCALGIFLSI
jgi:hypothetical protein